MAGLCVVSAVLTSLVQAREKYRSKVNAGVKLVELVKKAKEKKVSKSMMYTVNNAVENQEEGHFKATFSIENYRCVRSKSV